MCVDSWASGQLLNVNHVNLDELAVVRLGCRRDVGDDELFEVGDQPAVLAVAVKGDGRSAVDLDRLRVVDREDLMADFVLAIEKVVRRRRRDADLIDVVGGVVLLAADVEVLADLLAVPCTSSARRRRGSEA